MSQLLSGAPRRQTVPQPLAVPTSRSGQRDLLSIDLDGVLSGETSIGYCFQPLADLRRGVVAGYEVLARFPTRSGLPPDACLHAAARFGRRVELEELLMRQSLAVRHTLPDDVFLSLNVSPSYLLSRSWEQLMEEQESLAGIVLEITEQESIADYAGTRMRVAQIREKGGSVAIDDIGAGFASLKHILELRPNYVKLDRSFIHNCDSDRARSVLMEMMNATADRIDAVIVAEGVETLPELNEVIRLGIPFAQGYFLGRPVPELRSLSARSRAAILSCAGRRDDPDQLIYLGEPCAVAGSEADARILLDRHADHDIVAVVDRWNTPRAVLERHPVLGVRFLPSVMRCRTSSDIGSILQRALIRPPSARFDPILLLEESGSLHGVVRVDRLMQAALDGELASRTGESSATA